MLVHDVWFLQFECGLQKVPANDIQNGKTQRQIKTENSPFRSQ
jgi:hypothetical protein